MIYAADLFCGAGGTSTGLVRAAHSLGLADLDLLAVNHWKIAVATHTANHPWARHLCADLGSVDPSKVIPGGRLHLLVASPECTHHSVARGGKPCSDQSRASAWHVLHWAERLQVDSILIENVPEFRTWGPLGKRGRPLKRRRGDTFNAFLKALDSLGFNVDYRVLNAADAGAATTRKRLFIQGRRGRSPVWPELTHAGKWRGAREIIDWNLPGESILDRKKPLCAKTLARIAAGLRKFGGEAFLTVLNGTQESQIPCTARSVDEPLPSLQTFGHVGLCEPFLVAFHDERPGEAGRVHSVDAPLPTLDTSNRYGLARPFLVQTDQTGSNGACIRSVDAPLGTLVSKQNLALVTPFLLGQQSCGAPRSVEQPVPTIAGAGAIALVTATLLEAENARNDRPVDKCPPFLSAYYSGSNVFSPVSEPAPTIRTHDCLALVEPRVSGRRLDIRFRMLQPHELAAAMGFDAYHFSGNKGEQVKQIGNAVEVHQATALCRELLRPYAS